MSPFTPAELAYLQGERRLARLATVGPDGTPHITPVGMWSLDPDRGVVEVTGHDFAATRSSAMLPAPVAPPSWSTTFSRRSGHAGSRSAAAPKP